MLRSRIQTSGYAAPAVSPLVTRARADASTCGSAGSFLISALISSNTPVFTPDTLFDPHPGRQVTSRMKMINPTTHCGPFLHAGAALNSTSLTTLRSLSLLVFCDCPSATYEMFRCHPKRGHLGTVRSCPQLQPLRSAARRVCAGVSFGAKSLTRSQRPQRICGPVLRNSLGQSGALRIESRTKRRFEPRSVAFSLRASHGVGVAWIPSRNGLTLGGFAHPGCVVVAHPRSLSSRAIFAARSDPERGPSDPASARGRRTRHYVVEAGAWLSV